LDVCAAHSQRVDGGLDTWFCARCINNDVCAWTQIAFLDEVLGVLFCADSRAAELVCCGVLERELETLFVNVDCDDLLRAVGFCNGAA